MARFEIKLPDIGEGIAEAELSEWNVKVGQVVAEDDILAAVMTDKATVEVPTPKPGTILELNGDVGAMLAIGSTLVVLDIEGEETREEKVAAPEPAQPAPKLPKPTTKHVQGAKPLASPAVRKRAREEGLTLSDIRGSGPAGRIQHEDLDTHLSGARPGRQRLTRTEEVKITGMRRKIAEKMVTSASRIPHITIVEEVEMEALETLRATLNAKHAGTRPKLTLLPFLARALVEAVRAQPDFNARYDDDAGVLTRHSGVHIGIATQTGAGLTVPVLRHAEAATLWNTAGEITRLSDAAREGTIAREELGGSTITITSLGPLGAIATTPIINHPEVAILGVNKMQVRPVWDGTAFQPKRMMNLSASFDHRIIDGYDAAIFVQKIKQLLETPALMFVEQ
ncbi:MAG: dihydrolipoamide acetyltransferase family protein [Pseudomonadota bacterium]